MTFKPQCPYCHGTAQKCTGADVGYSKLHANKIIWRCEPCKAWVGCHPGTDKPLGRLANETLRRAKRAAHEAFDALWKPGTKQRCQTRERAYYWLALRLRIKPADCHIGMFDVEQCKQVVEVCTTAHGGQPI